MPNSSAAPRELIDQRLTTQHANGTVAPLRPNLHRILSCREIEILRHLVAGLPNKAIAKQLDLGEETVKVHVKGILRKLNVRNRTQAAVLAFSCGIGLTIYDLGQASAGAAGSASDRAGLTAIE